MPTSSAPHLTGRVAVEHRQADGRLLPFQPGQPAPTPVKAGDRLWLSVSVAGPEARWTYAIAAFRQGEYWRLGAFGPDAASSRLPWPEGHVLTPEEARMTTLFVVVSPTELAWARDLTRSDCGALVGKMPPEPAVSACDHLYGLFWQVPKRVRGMVGPTVERTRFGAVELPAIVAAHAGISDKVPYTVVEWQFKPRE